MIDRKIAENDRIILGEINHGIAENIGNRVHPDVGPIAQRQAVSPAATHQGIGASIADQSVIAAAGIGVLNHGVAGDYKVACQATNTRNRFGIEVDPLISYG